MLKTHQDQIGRNTHRTQSQVPSLSKQMPLSLHYSVSPVTYTSDSHPLHEGGEKDAFTAKSYSNLSETFKTIMQTQSRGKGRKEEIVT